MNPTEAKPTFTVPMAFEAHRMAEQHCQQHISTRRAKQAYLNSLAVYAVEYYLRYMGWETDRQSSESNNPLLRKFMNIADLVIPETGRLECCPVLPDSQVCEIPLEAWDDRIGYIAVQFDQSLRQAEILGFVQTSVEAVPLSQLQPLVELLALLDHNQQQSTSALQPAPEMINLGEWLQGKVGALWQTLEAVFSAPEIALSWRTKAAKQVQVLEFGDLPGNQQIALIVGITPAGTEMHIEMQICPMGNQIFLPHEVQVRLLNQDETEIFQTKAMITETIQLQFSGQSGERFSLEITSGDRSIRKTFVI